MPNAKTSNWQYPFVIGKGKGELSFPPLANNFNSPAIVMPAKRLNLPLFASASSFNSAPFIAPTLNHIRWCPTIVHHLFLPLSPVFMFCFIFSSTRLVVSLSAYIHPFFIQSDCYWRTLSISVFWNSPVYSGKLRLITCLVYHSVVSLFSTHRNEMNVVLMLCNAYVYNVDTFLLPLHCRRRPNWIPFNAILSHRRISSLYFLPLHPLTPSTSSYSTLHLFLIYSPSLSTLPRTCFTAYIGSMFVGSQCVSLDVSGDSNSAFHFQVRRTKHRYTSDIYVRRE